MKKIIFTILFLFFTTFKASASDWVQISDNAYIDKDTIKISGADVTFWAKIITDTGYSKQLINLDCANKTYAVMQSHNYNKKNEITGSYKNPTKPARIIPDTLSEIFYTIFKNKVSYN